MITTMTVQNIAQKVLFLQEMRGQISDGRWENSRPYDHYKIPSNIKYREIEVGKQIGINDTTYILKRKNYNFNDNSLFDCISDRMLVIAQIANYLGEDKINEMCGNTAFYKDLPESYNELQKIKEYASNGSIGSPYYSKKLAKFDRMGITEEILEQIKAETTYTIKDLRKDLKMLSKVWKTKRSTYVIPECK